MTDKKPWCGRWQAYRGGHCKNEFYLCLVKQEGPLEGGRFNWHINETSWIDVYPKPVETFEIHAPGLHNNDQNVHRCNLSDLPLPPIEYLLENEVTDFELTNSNYYLYD